jgi:hypothetical protein
MEHKQGVGRLDAAISDAKGIGVEVKPNLARR